jgi:N-acetylneuraminic acid mutarotase
MVAKPAVFSAGVAEDSWVSKAPMHVARSGLGVAVVNGKIYAIGGRVLVYQDQSRVESKEVNTNEEYDPAANTWTYKKSMPTPSSLFAIAVYNDKIYCMGSGKNQVYNPANDTWENKTAMPTERIMASANVVNGKIYVIGGHPNDTL